MNPFAEGTFNICTGEYIKSGNGCREEAAKIWTVEYQPLKHPNTGNPDDAVNLLNKVFIGTTGTEPVLTVDETDLTTDATQSFAANFTSAFGNDGAGTLTYALRVVTGTSGLTDTATGSAVNLSLNGAVVEGRSPSATIWCSPSASPATVPLPSTSFAPSCTPTPATPMTRRP